MWAIPFFLLVMLAHNLGFGGEGLPPPLSRAEYRSKANQLCRPSLLRAEERALQVIDGKARLYIRHGDLAAYKGAIRRQEIAIVLAPGLRKRDQRVWELGVPARDLDRVERILLSARAAAREAEENPFYFLASGSPMRRPRSLARAYGIESCAILYRSGGLYDRGSANPGARFSPRSSK